MAGKEELDFHQLEKDLNSLATAEDRYQLENDAKFRAMEQVSDYKQFQDFVQAIDELPSHLSGQLIGTLEQSGIREDEQLEGKLEATHIFDIHDGQGIQFVQIREWAKLKSVLDRFGPLELTMGIRNTATTMMCGAEVRVDPEPSMIDEPVQIHVQGLPTSSLVHVKLSLCVPEEKFDFESRNFFHAGSDGTLDLTSSPSLPGGTYEAPTPGRSPIKVKAHRPRFYAPCVNPSLSIERQCVPGTEGFSMIQSQLAVYCGAAYSILAWSIVASAQGDSPPPSMGRLFEILREQPKVADSLVGSRSQTFHLLSDGLDIDLDAVVATLRDHRSLGLVGTLGSFQNGTAKDSDYRDDFDTIYVSRDCLHAQIGLVLCRNKQVFCFLPEANMERLTSLAPQLDTRLFLIHPAEGPLGAPWTLSEAYQGFGANQVHVKPLGVFAPNSRGFNITHLHSIWDRRLDLSGLHLRVAYQRSRVYQDFKRDPSLDRGFNVEIFEWLRKWLNFTYLAYEPANDTGYGSRRTDGSFSGLIGEVETGRAHLAVADLTITEERRIGVDFAFPVKEIYKALLIQHPGVAAKMDSYIRVISTQGWIGLLTYMVLMTLTFTFLLTHWRRRFLLKVLKALAIIAQFIARPEKTYESHRMSSKLFMIVGLLSGFLIFAHYNALLTSFLTVNIVRQPFRSLEDLLEHPTLKLTINRETALAQIMRTSPPSSILRRLWDKKVANQVHGSIETYDEDRRLTPDAYLALAREYVVESSDYHLSDPLFTDYPCRITDVPQVKLFTELYGYAFPKRSPLLAIFNHALRRMDEVGLIDRIHQKYFEAPKRRACGRVHEFGLGESVMLFLVLGMGVGLSLVLVVLECFALN